MTGAVEKNYSLALFEAVVEADRENPEKNLEEARKQLAAVNEIAGSCDGFQKLMDSPAVAVGEKLEVLKEAFEGKISHFLYNFLCVVTEEKRWDYFDKINSAFSNLCNERLGIAEITVTTAYPLDDQQREKIKKKMAEITGKKIEMSEKTDSSLMGGIVVDYGDTRMDGSVKTRLENLKESLSQLIG
ncbi:MAG: ATP synthase F1 subunit delta [Firmicutes bacterium]|nr:ATP synthase F1 subunit delta [[Eubacterium] siraeum]MCM1488664.1 ATP synthase F1 subunit delta [Bacillota bacterium]